MVGLDAAGKTTILYKLKLGEIVTTIPTIGKETVSSFGGRVFTTPGDLSECNYFYSHRSNKLQLNKDYLIT